MKCFKSILIIFIILFTTYLHADEGMWPITEIDRIDLNSKGLKIEVNDIYNPDGISLMNAIVNLSGCTGSFVSSEGLIITNHHCAFGAVQRASTAENDYLSNGFLAKEKAEEIPAKGITASIMEFYKDVSKEVLSITTEEMDLLERTKAIEKKKKELVLRAEKEYPGKRAAIAEMFIGKTYLLFIYNRIKDIRLVYVPPVAIGEFGGENDNWIWPRHTGDFSFFRAYVAPDGSSADFSVENIPYQPKIHFQVAPQGVNEEDFVFIMGYPGRTYRHRTSYFMAFEENIRMPYLADEYEKAISIMEDLSKESTETALRLASPIKGYANRMKNYRGKLSGMKRLNLVAQRKNEEQKLQNYIDSDTSRKAKYGTVLAEIDEVYREKGLTAKKDLVLANILRMSTLFENANTVFKAAENREKEDVDRESAYMERNIQRTKMRMFLGLKSFYAAAESIILTDLMNQALNLPADQRIKAIDNLFSDQSVNDYVKNLYDTSKFSDEMFIKNVLKMSEEEVIKIDDPAMAFIVSIDPERKIEEEKSKRLEGALNKLHAKLIEVKKEFYKTDFIPDANGTFRLTYGYIRGYHPRDAVYASPITTFKGVIEKTTGLDPYITPRGLIDLYEQKDFGNYYNQKLKDVPVAILYNTDTTGGNSGSPVLNARGQLIGVNFDRAWEATINDYAWNENYSRSIAVDIRYVLWITQKYAGADYLLKEMNIPLN